MKIKTDHTVDFDEADISRALMLLLKEQGQPTPELSSGLFVRWMKEDGKKIARVTYEAAPATPSEQARAQAASQSR